MNAVFTIIVFCRYRTNLFFQRVVECLSRKTSMARVNNRYAYIGKKKKKEQLSAELIIRSSLHGSAVTSSCRDDISHFSDVKCDKYVSRLSCVRKKQNKLPQKRKVSFGCRTVARSKDKACKSRRRIQSTIINTH